MADGQAGGSAEGLEEAAPNPQSPIPNPQYATFLLHGVTGSGKTEIYLRAIGEVLRGGRQAVVLVPEIALTPQTIRRFAARYGGRVTVWHSELSDGERFDVWRRVRSGHAAAQVVVGSRSALMLPFPDLGLIVLDEEHEPSYKQERTPRYHARAVALTLGRLCGAAVILGSATPALETFYAARRGDIELLTLPRRILGRPATDDGRRTTDDGRRTTDDGRRTTDDGRPATDDRRRAAANEDGQLSLVADQPSSVIGQPSSVAGQPSSVAGQLSDLPPVQIVDLRQELRAGNRSIFSRALSAEMARVLAAHQQVILYLNRRGAATFVLCRDCGYVAACDRCATPLTYHGALPAKPGAGTPAAPTAQLVCHHCNRRSPTPSVCPKCQSRRIRFFGAGTEVVEEAIQAEFPHVRTLRWDRDVTGAKGSHDAILSKFTAHEADVLIGTQMIAKGLDLPLVTLVGVIAADVGLFLPDFRAGERSFQLLTQVAGRAGRSALGGRVIVQTYHPDHYAVIAASQHDYESFYRQEMVFRREQNYPPLARLARLICYHTQRDKAQAEAARLADLLRSEITKRGLADTDLIGPAPCFFAQERGHFRWHIVVRGPDPTAALRGLALPPAWRVDVDPVDLL